MIVRLNYFDWSEHTERYGLRLSMTIGGLLLSS